jgi:hypothetical protein
MHSEIKKFWECVGRVWEQTKPNIDLGLTSVPLYWFDKDNSLQRLIVAAPFNGKLVYRHPGHENAWVCEK